MRSLYLRAEKSTTASSWANEVVSYLIYYAHVVCSTQIFAKSCWMDHPFFGKAYEIFCKGLFTLYCSLQVKGRENLPPPPYILCSNHCSHMDTPALMLATGLPFHRFGMIGAKDYFFDNAGRRKFLSLLMNILPLERKPSRTEIAKNMEICKTFCASQRNLILYPEGTRSLTGEMQKFKKGAACFAYELQMPLIPAYIEGTFHSLPKGKNWIKPSNIQVTLGPALYVKEGGLVAYREATEKLEESIQQLREKRHA